MSLEKQECTTIFPLLMHKRHNFKGVDKSFRGCSTVVENSFLNYILIYLVRRMTGHGV